MNSLGMSKDFVVSDPSRRWKGIAIVLAVHALIGWALISGMARSGLNLLKKPLEAVVIQEVIIPPPPPPPPPPQPAKEIKQLDVKVDAPPPPFVPPPDIAPTVTPTAPTIFATPVAPSPAPLVVAPLSQAPQAPPAPPKNRQDIGIACPTQVAPSMPQRAIDEGISGVVKARIEISYGVVKDVVILSGPRVFHSAVKAAVMRYSCISDGDISATQDFTFKLE